MRNFWGASLVCLGLVTAAAMPAKADGVLVPVAPYPDSSATSIFSIDNNNIIVGSYLDTTRGDEHGFKGPLGGSYTSFDVGRDTQPRGSNDAGWIVGFSNSLGGDPSFAPSFQIRPDGKARFITKKERHLKGIVQGINNAKNTFTGSYIYKSGKTHGYVGAFGKWRRDIAPGEPNRGFAGRGINNAGDVVGWFEDSNKVQNGLLKSGKVATVINYPDPNEANTVLEGINDQNQIVGQWNDTNGIVHSFILDIPTKTFTEIDDPSAQVRTQAWNVNNAGVVTVDSDAGLYLWCATQDACPAAGRAVHGHTRVVKSFPQFYCDTTCKIPVTRVRGVQPVKPKGLIYQ